MKTLFGCNDEFLKVNKAIKENTLPKCLLILSPDSFTNELFSKSILSLYFCNDKSGCGLCPACLKNSQGTNPDTYFYPKENSFQVADANSIIDNAFLSPMIFDEKFFVINNVDNSTVAAQNKILKILEEPPTKVRFILNACNESKILPTIKSRCNIIRLQPIALDNMRAYFIQNKIDCSNLDASYEFGEGYVGKTLLAINNSYFNESNLLANSIVNELKSSKEVLSYSFKLAKNKDFLKMTLNLLQIKFNKMLACENLNYSKTCLVHILSLITLKLQEIESNVSVNIIADNFLMKILEYKYLYN